MADTEAAGWFPAAMWNQAGGGSWETAGEVETTGTDVETGSGETEAGRLAGSAAADGGWMSGAEAEFGRSAEGAVG